MKKLAHRGYSALYPENTMLAFEKAIERGFDGIETDVHLTKDNQLVLCHDERIDRTSNGIGYIKDMTLNELREYEFNYGKDTHERIPLLKDLLLLIKDKNIILNIELKTDYFHYEGIEQKVYDLVGEIGVKDQVVYSSFYLPSLLKMREIDDKVYIGYLFEDNFDDKQKEIRKYNIKHVHPRFDMIDEKIMEEYQNNGIDVAVWTIPNEEICLKMKKLGVNMVISNEYLDD